MGELFYSEMLVPIRRHNPDKNHRYRQCSDRHVLLQDTRQAPSIPNPGDMADMASSLPGADKVKDAGGNIPKKPKLPRHR